MDFNQVGRWYLGGQLCLEGQEQQRQVALRQQGKRHQGFGPQGRHRAVQYYQQGWNCIQLLLHHSERQLDAQGGLTLQRIQ